MHRTLCIYTHNIQYISYIYVIFFMVSQRLRRSRQLDEKARTLEGGHSWHVRPRRRLDNGRTTHRGQFDEILSISSFSRLAGRTSSAMLGSSSVTLTLSSLRYIASWRVVVAVVLTRSRRCCCCLVSEALRATTARARRKFREVGSLTESLTG